ncbi:MAG: protein kinase [Phycisphaerales bacterium]|nr:protein kinase [Phycisphaerales bacterium]MCB9857145.1 protein kinase [Phycisphaerales bacterium]MCB9861728.1 protein kinase [Phycisphaerales bacterium]
MTDCPSQVQLDRLFAGELSPSEESRLWKHIDDCPACSRKEPADEDRYGELVAHLKRLDLSSIDFDRDPETDLDLHAVRRHRTRTDDAGVADQIPGYAILSELHRGGQGVVYEATQQSTRRRVAIKVLLAGRYATPEAQRRFEREIELVASLKHPDIVAVFDSGRTRDDRQYCVMDLVTGLPLDKWLDDSRPAPSDALELFARICDAVHYAHQRGVIHRDLKPSNILIEADGAPKILDFGLARPTGASEQLVSMTGQILGTLPYMSPEQTRGSPDDIDIRTDVYSLGVVLYEMLTGSYPYPVDGRIPDVLKHIAETAPTRASRIWTPDSGIFTSANASGTARIRSCPVDEDLDTIVLKALSKEKERRYQTALDLARDVRCRLSGDAIVARRDSTWYVMRKSIRRHRAAFVSAAAFVILLAAWGAAITIGYSRERELNKALHEESLQTAIQRDRALEAEARSQKRFGQIREMAESFLFEFHDAIRDLPGSTEAREFVVTRSLAYLDRLAAESEDDATLMRDLVAAYMKVGDVQGGLGLANLGDTQGAIASYQEAQRLAKQWQALEPGNNDAARAAADALRRIGDMHFTQGNIDAALEAFRTALGGVERLAGDSPDNLSYQRDIRRLATSIGNTLAAAWRFDEANAAYSRAQAISESLIVKASDNASDRRDLAVVLLKQARAAINTEQPKESWIPKIDRSIELSRGVLSEEPNSVTFLRDLEIAYDFKAESLLKFGDADGALTQYRENLSLARRLLNLDPKNALAKHDLMIAHNNVARSQLALEKTDDALREFNEGLVLAKSLYDDDPTNYETLRDVGRSHLFIAQVHLAAGNASAATESCNASLSAFDAVAAHDPNNYAALRDVGQVLGIRCDLYLATGDDESADVSVRIDGYQKAAADFVQFRALLQTLKDNNRLGEQEVPYIAMLQDEIDRCNQAVVELSKSD